MACGSDPTLTPASVLSILAIRAICLPFHSAWLPLRGFAAWWCSSRWRAAPHARSSCMSDVQPIISINILKTWLRSLSVPRGCYSAEFVEKSGFQTEQDKTLLLIKKYKFSKTEQPGSHFHTGKIMTSMWPLQCGAILIGAPWCLC